MAGVINTLSRTVRERERERARVRERAREGERSDETHKNNFWESFHAYVAIGGPLSSEYGTYKTVKAKIWP